jgi:hypothetical protein
VMFLFVDGLCTLPYTYKMDVIQFMTSV